MSSETDNKDQERSAQDSVTSRRRFLKAGTKAMPVVLTLQSGAALARSSNLVSGAPRHTTDKLGRTLCLEADSVENPSAVSGQGRQVYDLGEPAYGRVAAIRDRNYRTRPRRRAERVSEATICEKGGTYYYRDRGWRQRTFKHGMVVSATAMTSFAGDIDIYEM